MWRKGNPRILLVRRQIGTAPWKRAWRLLKKLKIGSFHMTSNPNPGHISEEKESSNSERYMHTNAHSSIIHNSKDMEATQACINRWMDSEDAVYKHTHTYTHTLACTMEYHLAIKKNEILHLQQHRWTWRVSHLMKYIRVRIIHYHLYVESKEINEWV